MKVLVVGAGGREHALVWKIRRSPGVREVLCAPGSPGTGTLARSVPVPPAAVRELAAFAAAERVDLTVVGPELPLSLGIAGEFAARGLALFGAGREAAAIETSKAFAKRFLERHGIPTAPFTVHDDPESARRALRARREFPVVVKADGLAAGKGVTVAADLEAGLAAVRTLMEERRYGEAGDQIVIEDFLRGREASVFALTDGERVLPLAPCRDYKAALDGDRGPNTGGMGSYCPAPDPDPVLLRRIAATILEPTVRGLAAESRPYRGILYAGLMLTDGGPMVLEFNARFGDPEAQVLLACLQSDLVPLLSGCAAGRLEAEAVRWEPLAAVCVVLASAGYPGEPRTGEPIRGLDSLENENGTLVFHAGTRRDPDGTLRTAGGRVLDVVGLGPDLDAARRRAYAAVERIEFQGMRYRRDIAAPRTLAARAAEDGGGEL
ncbi:MAG: phosphoribosylamine--glycine ligase [Acidobacteria bacterium]|nr:phosphoribosylamine--glycine ligase [Acidobacteriota bacterium]